MVFKFENPENKPINKLSTTVKYNGKLEIVGGLDKFWVTKHSYCGYQKYKRTNLDEWKQVAEDYLKELNRLLSFPLYVFWSHLVYDKSVVFMLESFLQEATPWYELHTLEENRELYYEIYNTVFSVYDRIVHCKDSESEYLMPEQVGNLILKHEIITLSTIWDICQIYGRSNLKEINDIVQQIFELQPEYTAGLYKAFVFISEALDEIIAFDDLTEEQFKENVCLLLDIASNTSIFLQVYPEACQSAYEHNLHAHVLEFYEHGLEYIERLSDTIVTDKCYDTYIKYAKVEFIEIIVHICAGLLGNVMKLLGTNGEVDKWCCKYLEVLKHVVSCKKFFQSYKNRESILQNLELLLEIHPNINEGKHILDEIKSILSPGKTKDVNKLTAALSDLKIPSTQPEGAGISAEDLKRRTCMQEVLDALPHLGEGFVDMCMDEMGCDAERLIIAILDNDLPVKLVEVDQQLPRIPAEAPLVDNTRALPRKEERQEDIRAVLDDKSEIQAVKDRYQAYSLVIEDEEEKALYDDEYIDTYDDDSRPLKSRRNISESEESSSSSEEEAVESQNPPKDAFCEDPAVVRARYEARRAQRAGRRGGSHRPPADVVGKPQGQGQTEETQRSRDKKNVNKSYRGNHNRRAQAQWKRSRGMIPQ